MPNPIFSDALPIQIWVTGEQTFNEIEDCFVDSVCFNQEFQIDDVVRLVFTDDPGLSYVLKAIDLSGTIATLSFTEVVAGVYVLYFKGSDNSLIDRKCYVSIQRVTLANNTIQFVPAQSSANALNNQFTSGLDGWSGSAQTIWSNTRGGCMQTGFYPGSNSPSKVFSFPANAISATITVNGNNPNTTGGELFKVELTFFNGSTPFRNILLTNVYGDFHSVISLTKSLDATTLNATSIGITYTRLTGSSGHVGYIDDVNIDYKYLDISGLVQHGSGSGWTGSPLYGGSVLYTSGGEATGKDITKIVAVSGSKTFNVTYDVLYNGGASGTCRLEFVGYGADSIVHVLGYQDIASSGNKQFTGTFSGLISYTNFGVRYQALSSTGSITVAVEVLQFDFQTGDTEGIEAGRSDYIWFRTEVRMSTGIFYKSSKLFADIPYQKLTASTPPSPYFFIRVTSVFYHADNPTESKVTELSNSKIIVTSSNLKVRKEFDIQDAPDYFHRKIQLILMHAVSGSVVINNVEWITEGGYELTQRGEDGGVARYPFKFAKTFLTRKNYVVRNVI